MSTRSARSRPRSRAGCTGSTGAADFWRYGIELQHNWRLARGPRVLTVRLRGTGVTGERDEVPFTELPALGGGSVLRGISTSGSATGSPGSGRSSTSGTSRTWPTRTCSPTPAGYSRRSTRSTVHGIAAGLRHRRRAPRSEWLPARGHPRELDRRRRVRERVAQSGARPEGAMAMRRLGFACRGARRGARAARWFPRSGSPTRRSPSR